MPTFLDRFGRDWEVKFTIQIVRDLASDPRHPIDLLTPAGLKLLMSDPVSPMIVLWRCCRWMARSRNMNGDDFEYALADEAVLVDAVSRLYEDLENFFHRHRKPTLATMARGASIRLMRMMPSDTATPATSGNANEQSDNATTTPQTTGGTS